VRYRAKEASTLPNERYIRHIYKRVTCGLVD
jgi:hypothetical protein